MSEMVERVAAAAHDTFTGGLLGSWDEQSEANKSEWCELARAAIAAMREPTEDMQFAACDEEITMGNAKSVWQDMIDAALRDK